VHDALIEMSEGFAGLIMTTGGTGFGPRDLTPEGTRAAIEREAAGLAQAIRDASNSGGRNFGMLSRATAGTRGEALIVNAPGSSSGAVEAFEAIEPVVEHALDLLAGGRPH
jgi:molybdenum cofactor synthesis domain-containing protein